MKIEKDRILKAHKQGCDDVKNTLETLFPDVFEDDGLVLIEPFEVNTDSDKMIFIGHGMAPGGLRGKCLVLNDSHEWKIHIYNGFKILIPRKK